MDAKEQSDGLRRHETTALRTADARMSIDPGFVHHRLIQNLIGGDGMRAVNDAISRIPIDTPGHLRQLQIDHIYVDTVIHLCSVLQVPSLAQLLVGGRGRLFASVETTEACPEIYDSERVVVRIMPRLKTDTTVELEFATKRVAADTTRMELERGADVAIVGQVRHHDESAGLLRVEPLVIGGPSLESASPDLPHGTAIWLGFAFGEIFVEDIDEFSKVEDVSAPKSIAIMEQITERAVKQCLAEILGQEVQKDWGGEQSDLYSAHLHLNGRPASGAFLLKGPAQFKVMRMSHLGKNNDQIVRLSQEPADVLVVQHSHEIGTDVRTTLRAFANGLGPVRRRYCLIDGIDTLRILTAYDKLDHAVQLSKDERARRQSRRQGG